MRKVFILSLLLIAAAFVFSVMVPVPQAFGADTCLSKPSTSTCDGQDPYTAGCAADVVDLVTPKTVGSTTVRLRYSPKCQSAWSRVDWYGLTPPVPSIKACVYRKVLTTNSPQCTTVGSTNAYSNILFLGRTTYKGYATGTVNSGTPVVTAEAYGY